MILLSFASRLKERRESLGITQVQLAEKLGVTKGAVGNYEIGLSSPKAEILYKVFDVLGCDANFLFQDEMEDPKELATLDEKEYPAMSKYRRLSPEEQTRIDAMIDRVLSGQPMPENTIMPKKPAPTDEGELDKAIIDMVLKLQLSPYELQRLVDFAKGLAAARTKPPSDKYSGR